MRLSAPRCVILAALAIVGADTIGRDKTSSMVVGRLLEERRPFWRPVICAHASDGASVAAALVGAALRLSASSCGKST